MARVDWARILVHKGDELSQGEPLPALASSHGGLGIAQNARTRSIHNVMPFRGVPRAHAAPKIATGATIGGAGHAATVRDADICPRENHVPPK